MDINKANQMLLTPHTSYVLCASFHETLPSSIVPLHDLVPKKSFPFKASEHRVLLPSLKLPNEVLHGGDKSLDLIQKKNDWLRRATTFHSKNVKEFEKIDVDSLKEIAEVSSNLPMNEQHFRFLKLMQCDPDRYFSKHYNYYYSSGTLSTFMLNNKNVLCSAQNENLGKLHVVKLNNKNNLKPIKRTSALIDLPTNDTIFQILGKEIQQQGYICTRQRNTISLLSVTNGKPLNLQLLDSCSSEEPFTSVDINPWKLGEYCYATCSGTITACTAEKRSIRKLTKKDRNTVGWCHAEYEYSNPEVLLSANSSKLEWFDLRCSKRKPLIKFKLSRVENVIDSCEDISLVFPSKKNSMSVYVGTTHRLFEVDKRMTGPEIVLRWSHMLASPPLLCATQTLSNGSELVSFADLTFAEVANVISNNKESLIIPYHLKTCSMTLTKHQVRGQDLDPALRERLCQGLIGMVSVSDNCSENIDIITQTAAGDIFSQKLCPNENDIDAAYESDFSSLKPDAERTLYASHRINLEPLAASIQIIKQRDKSKGRSLSILKNKVNTKLQDIISGQQNIRFHELMENWNLGSGPEKVLIDFEKSVPEQVFVTPDIVRKKRKKSVNRTSTGF